MKALLILALLVSCGGDDPFPPMVPRCDYHHGLYSGTWMWVIKPAQCAPFPPLPGPEKRCMNEVWECTDWATREMDAGAVSLAGGCTKSWRVVQIASTDHIMESRYTTIKCPASSCEMMYQGSFKFVGGCL